MSALRAYLAGRAVPPRPNPEDMGSRNLGRTAVLLARQGFVHDPERLGPTRAALSDVPGHEGPRALWEAAEARGLLPEGWTGAEAPRFCFVPPSREFARPMAPDRDTARRIMRAEAARTLQGLLASGEPLPEGVLSRLRSQMELSEDEVEDDRRGDANWARRLRSWASFQDDSLAPLWLGPLPRRRTAAFALIADAGGAERARLLGEDFLGRLLPLLGPEAQGPYEIAYMVYERGWTVDRSAPEPPERRLRPPAGPLMGQLLNAAGAYAPEAARGWREVRAEMPEDLREVSSSVRHPWASVLGALRFAYFWRKLACVGVALPDVTGLPKAPPVQLADLPDPTEPLLRSFLSGWGPLTRQDPDPETGAPGVLVLATRT